MWKKILIAGEDIFYCTKCGKTLPRSVKYCPYCGNRVRQRVLSFGTLIAIMGCLGVIVMLVYLTTMISTELVPSDFLSNSKKQVELSISDFIVQVDDNNDIYVRYSFINSEGKIIRTEGAGTVRIIEIDGNKEYYEKFFFL